MAQYRVRLVRSEDGTQLPVGLLTTLLDALFEGSLRALRLRIEGRSTRGGATPQWLREAASFSLAAVSAGSVVLVLEAEPLQRMLPPFAIGLLDPGFVDKPCVALFVQSLQAALSGPEDLLLYDSALLATFESLAALFSSGVERLDFLLDEARPEPTVSLRAEDTETIARLRRRVTDHQEKTLVVSGHVVRIDLPSRTFMLRSDTGEPLRAVVDDLLVDQLSPFLGQRVTISGRAMTDAGGTIQRFSADSIQPAAEVEQQALVEGEPAPRLSGIQVSGFKSIRDLARLAMTPINVLIGANGAGKSNFVSFFRLLIAIASSGDTFATHVARSGGAGSLLHDGPAVTPEITGSLTFEGEAGSIDYSLRLVHGAPDALIFAEEKYRAVPTSARASEVPWTSLGAGGRESGLHRATDPSARRILSLLRRIVVYQFHDTSETARIRQRSAVSDNALLRSDAGNLAPFLLRLKESERDAYDRIVETIRQIVPFFDGFFLEPLRGTVLLQWRERGTDTVFQPHQASDGMLRVMALVALLLQPHDALPALLIVDEPELGLHPYAVNVIAGLFRSTSKHAQIALATQSMAFVDHFTPDEIIVLDRPDRDSRFVRLEAAALDEWLEDYSLGELWEKNVIGGRPR